MNGSWKGLFSDAASCKSNWKYEGTDYSYNCALPFKYDGNWHYNCTYSSTHKTPWCSHDYDYDGNWGYCSPSCPADQGKPINWGTTSHKVNF